MNMSHIPEQTRQYAALSTVDKPHLIVVIDTEEEFDWYAEPSRSETSINSMQNIHLVQDIFDEYGIKPCYVVDYPVITQTTGSQPLSEIHADGRCEIGAHLHPWVTPPFTENVSRQNTFPGNLEFNIELDKLSKLSKEIESVVGQKPTIYKAGRYGFGANTTEILSKLGYEIDLSFCPPVDYSNEYGPDYSRDNARPFWFGESASLLEIPVTGAFVGFAGGISRYAYNFAQKFNRLKTVGIFSRLGIVDRLMLSPEGFNSNEHQKITNFLLNQGNRIFTWSFHSSSVMPGGSPYVSDNKSLNKFLDSFHRYFDYFFTNLEGVASTPSDLKFKLEQLK